MDFNDIIDFCIQTSTKYQIDGKTADITSVRIGKTARLIVYPSSVEIFCTLLHKIRLNNYKFTILGNGTNCYFCDNYNGIVLCTKYLDSILVNDNLIVAMCGANLSNLCAMALFHSLSGLEFAYGIPGTVGGALYMNAAAFGGAIGDLVEKTVVYDIESDTVLELDNKSQRFNSKKSIFSKNKSFVVLQSCLKLTRAEYDTIKSKMQEYSKKRKDTQPLNMPSSGSAFKRSNGIIPSLLIDKCGLKGYKIGGAEISKKHAGFIVNSGGATAENINDLLSYIKAKVLKEFDVNLEEEIIYIE